MLPKEFPKETLKGASAPFYLTALPFPRRNALGISSKDFRTSESLKGASAPFLCLPYHLLFQPLHDLFLQT